MIAQWCAQAATYLLMVVTSDRFVTEFTETERTDLRRALAILRRKGD